MLQCVGVHRNNINPMRHTDRDSAYVAVGVNRNDINPMRHGETSMFKYCTELFPSPSGDNYRDPCLDFSQYTMYTTGGPQRPTTTMPIGF